MISVYAQSDRAGLLINLTIDDVGARLTDSTMTFWIDLEDPTDEEVQALQKVFSFHHLCIEDCLSYSNAPKLDEFDDYLFLVTHEPHPDEITLVTGRPEVDFFLGINYLVSFHYHQSRAIDKLKQRCTLEIASADTTSVKSSHLSVFRNSDFILQNLLDVIVDDYFPMLDRWEQRISEMEDRLLEPSIDRPQIGELILMKRELAAIRRLVSPQRDVLSRLIHSSNAAISKHSRFYFQDVHDHLIRAYEIIDSHRDAMHNVLEAYYSLLSTQMNENSNRINFVMQRLTIITTIFMPLSFIAGVYGMNFAQMPELHWTYGYVAVLGFMAIIVTIMLVFFRRQRWL